MEPATFFAKFDQFAEAPNAVAKLRELVFELAPTGWLIPDILEHPAEDDNRLLGNLAALVMGKRLPVTNTIRTDVEPSL